jgi:hypothetical protein
MIKEITMYSILCNKCGKDVCEEDEYSGWNDQGYVNDIAMENGWHIDEDAHYCPDCYEYDEEDNIRLT